MNSLGRDDERRDAVTVQLEARLRDLVKEQGEVLAALRLRRLESDQASGDLARNAGEAVDDMRKARDALIGILPALVTEHERYEGRDGVLDEPVLTVAEVIGRLDAGACLLTEE